MSLELLNTFGTFGTFVVIAATALAALVQLRHLRRANQLAGLQSMFEMLQEPSVRELVNFVRHNLSERMKDPRFRTSLLAIPVDRSEHPELYLCDIYNHIGSFVRSRLIDEDIYLQTDWYNVTLYWGLLRDTIAQGRQNRPHIFENFEWLAARARAWTERHPHGDYPANAPRMIQSDSPAEGSGS
jgi:hypothetical protein